MPGCRPIPVAVNISAVEFRSSGFLENVVDILNDTGLDPRYLELELTESVLMAHVEATSSVLHALKDMGVQLAIDDFGTGWSSLSYLRTVSDRRAEDRPVVRPARSARIRRGSHRHAP